MFHLGGEGWYGGRARPPLSIIHPFNFPRYPVNAAHPVSCFARVCWHSRANPSNNCSRSTAIVAKMALIFTNFFPFLFFSITFGKVRRHLYKLYSIAIYFISVERSYHKPLKSRGKYEKKIKNFVIESHSRNREKCN